MEHGFDLALGQPEAAANLPDGVGIEVAADEDVPHLARLLAQEPVDALADEAGLGLVVKAAAKAAIGNGKPTGEKTTDGKDIYAGPRGGRFFISSEGKKVYLSLRGACGCCPHATMTIKGGLERILKAEIDPEIEIERVL